MNCKKLFKALVCAGLVASVALMAGCGGSGDKKAENKAFAGTTM